MKIKVLLLILLFGLIAIELLQAQDEQNNDDSFLPQMEMNPASNKEELGKEINKILANTTLSTEPRSGGVNNTAVIIPSDSFTTNPIRSVAVQSSITGVSRQACEADDNLSFVSLTLDDFRNAAEAYPEAKQFIMVKKDGNIVIQTQDKSENISAKSENREILKRLKDLIADNYSSDIAASISELKSFVIKNGDALSTERLKNIFQSADLLWDFCDPNTMKQKSYYYNWFDKIDRLFADGLKDYMQRGLEGIVQDTPSNRRVIEQRAIMKAKEAGCSESQLKELSKFLNQSADFRNWLKRNALQLRSIPPSLVEEEIKNPGTTDIKVVQNIEGVVITVYRKDSVLDQEDQYAREEDSVEFSRKSDLYWTKYFELENGTDGGTYLVPNGRVTYHNIRYTEHAIERMALDTPSNRKKIADRLIEKMRLPKEGEKKLSEDEIKALQIFFDQPIEFQDWWKDNDPQLQKNHLTTIKKEEKEIKNSVPYFIEISAYLLREKKNYIFFEEGWHAKRNENSSSADLWRKSSLQWRSAIESLRRAMEARISETELEFNNFYRTAQSSCLSASCLEEAAISLMKATEAEQNDQQSFALLWEKLAEQYQQFLLESDKKVTENSVSPSRIVMGDFNTPFRFTVYQLSSVAHSLDEASRAAQGKRQALSERWEKIAEQYLLASEYERKAASENECFHNFYDYRVHTVSEFARQSADCFKKSIRLEQESQSCRKEKTKEKKLLQSKQNELIGEDYQKAAKALILKNTKESIQWEKAAKAERIGNPSLGSLWRQSAEKQKVLAECKRQLAEARSSENKEEITRLEKLFYSTWESAGQLEKAVNSLQKTEEWEEEEKIGNSPLAILCKQSTEKEKIRMAYFLEYSRQRELAAVGISGNKRELVRLKHLIVSPWRNAYQSEEANKLLEKAATVKEQKIFVGYKKQLDVARNLGNKEEITRLEKQFYSASKNINHLEEAAELLENAVKAEKNSNLSSAVLWRQSAEQHQIALDYFHKATEVFATGNKEEYTNFDQAADAAIYSANCLAQAADWLEEATKFEKNAIAMAEKGNESQAALLRQSSEYDRIGADYFQQASKARTSGNAYVSFDKAAHSASASACFSEEAFTLFWKAEFYKNKNTLFFQFWQQCVEFYKNMAAYQQRVTEGYALGEEGKLEYWDKLDRLITKSDDQLDLAAASFTKYSESVESSNQREATLWKKSADIRKNAVEQYMKSVEACFNNTGDLADLWEKAAQRNSEAAVCYEGAAEAFASGKEEDDKEEGDKKDESKKDGDKKAGNTRVPWKRASVDQEQRSFGLRNWASQTYSKNRTLEQFSNRVAEDGAPKSVVCLSQAGDLAKASAESLKYAATSFEQASKAKESSSEVTNLYQKACEQYQSAARCWNLAAQVSILKCSSFKRPQDLIFYEDKDRKYQNAAECYQKAAKAYTQGNETEGDRFNRLGDIAVEEVKALKKGNYQRHFISAK